MDSSKTKTFRFVMAFQVTGRQAVEVPASIETEEEAQQWVRDHWDEIKLPDSSEWEYVPGVTRS